MSPYVRQKEALGLGHAVLMSREAVGGEPFAVMLGDDHHRRAGSPA
jgi:UTP--glucose-1-phosphate uridylyltransferase